MEKTVLSKSKFSHGVLQVKFQLQPNIVSDTELIDHVRFYEFVNGQYNELDVRGDDDSGAIYKIADNAFNTSTEKQTPAEYVVDVSQQGAYTNHLIKAVIYMRHNDLPENALCCSVTEGEFFVFEDFFVDMTAYEKTLVESVNLKCDDCDVSLGTINGMLKLFAVQAAVESQSPMLEFIFSKVACGKGFKTAPVRLPKECNCNG